MDISGVNVSSGDFYQALLGCNILGRLYPSATAVLGPAVIHMLGPVTAGYVSWMQSKLGCMVYANMLMPSVGGVSPIITTQLPPLPANKSVTFESKGIRLSKEHKKQLRELAREQDA